jgi:hypothetical protein
MKRLVPILLAASLCLGAAPPPPRDSWLADYRLLKQKMESDYSNLAWFGSPESGVDLPRLDRRATEALASAASVEEARIAVRDFIAALDDGHFSVLPPPGEEVPGAAEPAKRDLSSESAEQACAALGYANRSPIAFSLPFESLPGFTLIEDGEKTSFRSGLLRAGGRTVGLIRIRNFGPAQYPRECETAWRTAPAAVRADDEAFSDRVQLQWLASLAAAIGRVRADKPDAMLVDVGSNSGGSDIGEWSPRLFTSKPLRGARLLMTAGPLAAEYLDGEIAALETALRGKSDAASLRAGNEALATLRGRRAAAGARCVPSWAWTERRAWNPSGCARLADVGFASGILALRSRDGVDETVARRIYWPAVTDRLRGSWTGPLFVLVNGTTYSAAEMFAALLQNNRAATILGSRSGGDGCGFMIEAKPLLLPALGMRIRMPNCVRLRADGSDEVAGIEPDLKVAPREGESPRARAGRAAAVLVSALSSADPNAAGGS